MRGRPRFLGLEWLPAFPEEEITDTELDAVAADLHALRERSSQRGSNL